MVLDTRYDPPRLLICDRNHQPKGRLVHYTLEGEFIEEVVTGLGMPTSAAIQGDFVSVPDLQGRVVILDKSNTIIAVFGHNPDPKKGGSFNVHRRNGSRGSSAVRMVRTGIRMEIYTFKIGTWRAASSSWYG